MIMRCPIHCPSPGQHGTGVAGLIAGAVILGVAGYGAAWLLDAIAPVLHVIAIAIAGCGSAGMIALITWVLRQPVGYVPGRTVPPRVRVRASVTVPLPAPADRPAVPAPARRRALSAARPARAVLRAVPVPESARLATAEHPAVITDARPSAR
jgi:hypothetical protein